MVKDAGFNYIDFGLEHIVIHADKYVPDALFPYHLKLWYEAGKYLINL